MVTRQRARAIAAGTAVAIAGTGIALGLWLGRDTDDEQLAAIREHLKPASQALGAITRPTGFQECTRIDNADLCWQGRGSEVDAVPLLVSVLQEAGATDLVPRCVRLQPSTRVLCRVDGNLKGAALDSLISMNGGDLQVVVYAAMTPPPDLLRKGTPIPLVP